MAVEYVSTLPLMTFFGNKFCKFAFVHSTHTRDMLSTLMIVDSCIFRVDHLHYQHDEYEGNPELVGYEEGGYDHDYHSDDR